MRAGTLSIDYLLGIATVFVVVLVGAIIKGAIRSVYDARPRICQHCGLAKTWHWRDESCCERCRWRGCWSCGNDFAMYLNQHGDFVCEWCWIREASNDR